MWELIEDFLCMYEDSREAGKADRGELLDFIGFVQHERAIHLAITVVTAAIWLILMALQLIFPVVFLIPAIAMTIVLICYILYYCKLENTVQMMYRIYEEMDCAEKPHTMHKNCLKKIPPLY